MTLVFECFDTVRFQVQEMARAERIATDEGIQGELDVYNRLLPGDGELSATLFIELTSDDELRQWLPRLVGIERAVGHRAAPTGEVVGERARAAPTPRRSPGTTVTPAVHYVRFGFRPAQVGGPGRGAAAGGLRHPAYEARTELGEATRAELAGDLRGAAALAPLALSRPKPLTRDFGRPGPIL